MVEIFLPHGCDVLGHLHGQSLDLEVQLGDISSDGDLSGHHGGTSGTGHDCGLDEGGVDSHHNKGMCGDAEGGGSIKRWLVHQKSLVA